MNTDALTHGTNGFLLGFGLVVLPLWVGLAQGRAPLRAWILSPLSAILCLFVAGIVNFIGHTVLGASGIPPSLSTLAAIASYLLVGYAGGRTLAAQRKAGEVRKRGALLQETGGSGGPGKRKPARADAMTLAGIEVPLLDETKHFKLIGTTGSGKSTAIREVLRTALARGDRAVIADPDGAYLQHFYDPRRGDEILNPFDPRSVQWDLFSELRAPYDIDQLARALIADSPDLASREWRGYARTFLASLLRSGGAGARPRNTPSQASSPSHFSVSPHSPGLTGTAHSPTAPASASHRPAAASESVSSDAGFSPSSASAPPSAGSPGAALDLTELWRRLMSASPEELRGLLTGTPAQAFLASGNEKMFGSMRSVATAACAALEHIAAQRATPFSIRSWVHPLRGGGFQEEARAIDGPSSSQNGPRAAGGAAPSGEMPPRSGVLFLPYSAGEIATLRTMIATWLRLAIFEAMNGSEGDQRLWFVIDELDALGAIDGLKDALARVRKFGGRCVLGFQSIGQVSALYGRGDSQTIVENCGNTLILRCSASEGGGTAQFASRLIGDRDIVRTQVSETVSRDGVSFIAPRRRSTTTSLHHATEPAVLPAEIEQLPDLSGYLKLASRPEWMKVRIE